MFFKELEKFQHRGFISGYGIFRVMSVAMLLAHNLHTGCGNPTTIDQGCSRWPQKLHNEFSDCLYEIPHRFFQFGFGHGGNITGNDIIATFGAICASLPSVDFCMKHRLKDCSTDVLEVFERIFAGTMSFCDRHTTVNPALSSALTKSQPVNNDVITRCQIGFPEAHACRRAAQENALRKRNDLNLHYATVNPSVQTRFLLDVMLCQQDLYSENCPDHSFLLTVVYNQNELAPPRLGANIMEVLLHLALRQRTNDIIANLKRI